MKNSKYRFLSGGALKIIAVLTMLTDHIGAALLGPYLMYGQLSPESYEALHRVYRVLRNAGRTAFPVFCFLLVEGCLHTRDKRKYALRLLGFSVLSEAPFDLAVFGKLTLASQNVFFTLLIGLLVVWGMQIAERMGRGSLPAAAAQAAVLAVGAGAAAALHTDYGAAGVILIAVLYLCRGSLVMAGIAGYLVFLWEAWSFPGFLAIQFYNGKRGIGLKYFFYLFYPLHLLILAVLRLWILKT